MTVCRDNRLSVAGWAAVVDALEFFTSLTSLNDCDLYSAIRVGGETDINLLDTDLALWAAPFLERSASSLERLNFWCAAF